MATLTLSSAASLRVAAVWGTGVVRTMDLGPGQSCVLGDEAGALIPMPDDLFASNAPVRAVSGGWEVDTLGATGGVLRLQGIDQDPTRITAGAAVRLQLGDFGLLQYGELSVFFQLGMRAPPVPEPRRVLTLSALSTLLSIALHAGLFAAAFALTRTPALLKPAELSSRDDIAARFGIRPDLIRPTPGPWLSESVALAPGADRHRGGPGGLSAADLQGEVNQAVSKIKSVGASGSGRKPPETAKPSAVGNRRVVASAVTGTADGGLSKEKVRQVVSLHVAPLQICYENEVQRIADLKGDVSIAWQIAADGSVAASSISRSSLGLARAESCMLRQVKEWSFPPSAAATNVTWQFSFALAD
jgi:hypothetical protein